MPSSPHSLSLYLSCIWVPFNPIFPLFHAFNPPLSSLLLCVGFPFLVWRCGLIIEYFWMDLDPAYDLFFFSYHLISCIGYFRGGDRGLSTLSLEGSMQTRLDFIYTFSGSLCFFRNPLDPSLSLSRWGIWLRNPSQLKFILEMELSEACAPWLFISSLN